MAATISEIAKHAGVSVGLVSRLVRGDATLRISEKRRQEILTITREMGGVRANCAARSLAKQKAYNFAMPINRIFSNDWLQVNLAPSPLIRNLEAVLKEKDFRLSVNFFDENNKYEYFSEIIDSKDYCDGLVLLHGLVDEPLAKLLKEREYPHICVDSMAERFGINTVCDHAMDGMRQSINHLRSLGHHRIGFLGSQHECSRYRYYLSGMAEEGMEVDPEFHCSFPYPTKDQTDYEWSMILRKTFHDWIVRGPKATALICQIDRVALVAVDVMQEMGLVPGRDLSLVGYDNFEGRGIVQKSNPILTTVDNPTDMVGRRCGELLMNQVLYNQRQIVHESLPVKLIVRESTGPCLKDKD